MKIALAGASGSGKTTLARLIANTCKMRFRENSAGLIMLQEDKQYLQKMYGYEGNWGQEGVYLNSVANPNFGIDFQRALFKARLHVLGAIKPDESYVWDRSTLDILAFTLNQVMVSDAWLESLVKSVRDSLDNYDLIIRTSVLDGPIEDNGSRIANRAFQLKMDAMFDLALKMVGWQNNPKVIYVGNYSVGNRFHLTLHHINRIKKERNEEVIETQNFQGKFY